MSELAVLVLGRIPSIPSEKQRDYYCRSGYQVRCYLPRARRRNVAQLKTEPHYVILSFRLEQAESEFP